MVLDVLFAGANAGYNDEMIQSLASLRETFNHDNTPPLMLRLQELLPNLFPGI